MTRNIFDYFEKRAEEEIERAATSPNPAVRETHQRFAAFYRDRLKFRDETPGSGDFTGGTFSDC